MSRIIRYPNLNEKEAIELLDGLQKKKETIYKVPIDPTMHQKPSTMYAPVSYGNLLSIILNAHRSARYRIVIERGDEWTIVKVEGNRKNTS